MSRVFRDGLDEMIATQINNRVHYVRVQYEKNTRDRGLDVKHFATGKREKNAKLFDIYNDDTTRKRIIFQIF